MIKCMVIACRYGDIRESMPFGVFDNKGTAIVEAKKHREYRGGKYDHILFEVDENKHYNAGELKGEWITGGKNA